MLSNRTATFACHMLAAFTLASVLSGCMGAPIAQQVASSLLMRAADRVTSDAYDTYLLQAPAAKLPAPASQSAMIPGHGTSSAANNTQQPQLDEYWSAFLNAGFTEIKPTTEPLPSSNGESTVKETPQHAIAVSDLTAIETWSVMLGEEKHALLEQARMRGHDLPEIQEWPHWQLAMGASKQAPQSPVTFLVPPELGRVSSGEELLVEISPENDLHIARYRIQQNRSFTQAER